MQRRTEASPFGCIQTTTIAAQQRACRRHRRQRMVAGSNQILDQDAHPGQAPALWLGRGGPLQPRPAEPCHPLQPGELLGRSRIDLGVAALTVMSGRTTEFIASIPLGNQRPVVDWDGAHSAETFRDPDWVWPCEPASVPPQKPALRHPWRRICATGRQRTKRPDTSADRPANSRRETDRQQNPKSGVRSANLVCPEDAFRGCAATENPAQAIEYQRAVIASIDEVCGRVNQVLFRLALLRSR